MLPVSWMIITYVVAGDNYECNQMEIENKNVVANTRTFKKKASCDGERLHRIGF